MLIYQSLIESQAEVYKDGLPIQQAVANKQTTTVQSEIYDLPNERIVSIIKIQVLVKKWALQ